MALGKKVDIYDYYYKVWQFSFVGFFAYFVLQKATE